MLTFVRKQTLPLLLVIVVLPLAPNLTHQAQELPALSYDVRESSIWKCYCGDYSTLYELESVPELVILHHDSSSRLVHFLSSDNRSLTEKLPRAASVEDCLMLGRFADLVDMWSEFPAGRTMPTIPYSPQIDNHLKRRSADDDMERAWFQKYHDVTEMYSWFEDLAQNHPRRVRLSRSIGRSYFGRDIMAVHITNREREGRAKPKIYLQCLLHAREWITGPVCMYVAKALATGSSSDSSQAKMIRHLLEKLEFVIVPVANPDGYYVTWVEYPKYRFWRKNLSKLSGTSCMGVDLNRNFDIKWSELGSSSDPCSETYHGASVESESEIKAIVSYLKQNRPFVGAIDFHSFSQVVVYPYGYTTDIPPDEDLMKSVADQVAAAMTTKGSTYEVHQMGSVYLASGTLGDWMFSDGFMHDNQDSDDKKLRMVPLTIELRPTKDGSNYPSGFMVPVEQILPTCEEVLPAIFEFASIVSELDQTSMDVY